MYRHVLLKNFTAATETYDNLCRTLHSTTWPLHLSEP